MELSLSGPSSSWAGGRVMERDLIGKLAETNYEDSGVDVSLSLKAPEAHVKRCLMCGETSTPLWRNGPQGPKTACNACGIRYRKEEQRVNTSLTLGPSNPSMQLNRRNRAA